MKMVVFVVILALANSALAGPFGKDVESKAAGLDEVSAALVAAEPRMVERLEKEFGEKGESIAEKDIRHIRSIERRLRSVADEKGWNRQQFHKSVLATWGAIRLSREGDRKNDLDIKKFETLFGSLEYVEIKSVPEGAKIEIEDYGKWDETNDDGFLPAGDVTIILTKTGFVAEKFKKKVEQGKRNEFEFELTRDK